LRTLSADYTGFGGWFFLIPPRSYFLGALVFFRTGNIAHKQSKSPLLINATSAFNRLSGIYHGGFKMNFPDLEKLGFEFFEYTGMQTMVLTI